MTGPEEKQQGESRGLKRRRRKEKKQNKSYSRLQCEKKEVRDARRKCVSCELWVCGLVCVRIFAGGVWVNQVGGDKEEEEEEEEEVHGNGGRTRGTRGTHRNAVC